MDDTPLEQVVVALATKCTGDADDEPVVGDVILTVANAGRVNSDMSTRKCFIRLLQLSPICIQMRYREKQLHWLQVGAG
jgi:hypothetical protein